MTIDLKLLGILKYFNTRNTMYIISPSFQVDNESMGQLDIQTLI